MTARARWTGAVLGFRWRMIGGNVIAVAGDCKPMPRVTLRLERYWYAAAAERYCCDCVVDGAALPRIHAASWRGLDKLLRERLKQLASTAQKAAEL
jgi:hypothetical protein